MQSLSLRICIFLLTINFCKVEKANQRLMVVSQIFILLENSDFRLFC